MNDFRLAVRQHAIVKDFELATAHSDTERFRGHCASLGCPWIIRARTQHGGSVRVLCILLLIQYFCNFCMAFQVMLTQILKWFASLQVQINEGVHTCVSRNKVPGGAMASQGWVAEMA